MKSSVAMAIEGVLLRPVSSSPILQGLLLYRALVSVSSVVLVSNETAQPEMEDWLLTNGITGYADLYCQPGVYRLAQINKLRAQGRALDLVVEPSLENVYDLHMAGYDCLHFLTTSYAIPSWRPDYQHSVRPWDQVAEEIALTARMKAADARLMDREED